jgi:hypothetical protein
MKSDVPNGKRSGRVENAGKISKKKNAFDWKGKKSKKHQYLYGELVYDSDKDDLVPFMDLPKKKQKQYMKNEAVLERLEDEYYDWDRWAAYEYGSEF